MREEDTKRESFTLLSDETKAVLETEKKDQKYMYVARKGLAPTVSCLDCGSLVICHECQAPMTLYGAKKVTSEKAIFKCNKCGASRSALETCKTCGSWRLQQYGVGIEGVSQELIKKYPDRTVFIIDGEHTKTPKEINKTLADFYTTPGAVLIGTELALNYITRPIHHIHIVSIDALLALPHYAIKERLMRLLVRMRSYARTSFVIQTRIPEESLWKHIHHDTLADFYRKEFIERKQFNYPPFSTLIKLTVMGQNAEVKKHIASYKTALEACCDTSLFEATHYTSPFTQNGKHLAHLLIKVQKWPEAAIVSYLQSLPPFVKVMVNPEHLI